MKLYYWLDYKGTRNTVVQAVAIKNDDCIKPFELGRLKDVLCQVVQVSTKEIYVFNYLGSDDRPVIVTTFNSGKELIDYKLNEYGWDLLPDRLVNLI